MIHDDAWFAKTPELDAMISLLRPGGPRTMANWFLLIDTISGEPRNDWAAFAGPSWRDDVLEYARLLANRADLSVVWVTKPRSASQPRSGRNSATSENRANRHSTTKPCVPVWASEHILPNRTTSQEPL